MDRPIQISRGRRVLRLIIPLLLLLAAVVIGIQLYPSLQRWASSERSVDADTLRFAIVERGDLVREVSVQGKVIAAFRPTLVSPVQGVVTLLARAGDIVRTGTVLARVESPELLNRLDQEKSILLSMEADLQRQKVATRQADLENVQEVELLHVRRTASERSVERARSLYEERLGSAMDYEKAQDDLKVISLELRNAEEKTRLGKETSDFDLRNRELLLDRQRLVVNELDRKIAQLNVTSPVDGLVSRVEIRDKDTVQPSQPLFSVVDLSRFEVEIQIPEEYADEVGPGADVVIVYGDHEYPGTVKSLSPEVEASQVRSIVAFKNEGPAGLKQNQRVSTKLLLGSRTNVLKVARGPFLESLGGRQAYVVHDRLAVLQPITAGAVSVSEVEIVSGLEAGEQIIVSDMSAHEGVKKVLLTR